MDTSQIRFDPKIYQSVSSLDSVCDGAHSEDGYGFNGVDAGFWKGIAASRTIDQWTPALYAAAYKMLRKYRVQLLNYGIDYDSIIPPKMERYIRKGDRTDRILIFFDYSKQVLDSLKSLGLSDLKFYKDESKNLAFWHCESTLRNVRLLRSYAEVQEFEINDDAETLFVSIENGSYVPPAPAMQPISTNRSIQFINELFVLITGGYEATLVDSIKSYFPARKFEKVLGKFKNVWTVKPNIIQNYADFQLWASGNGFTFSSEAAQKIADITATRTELFEFSNLYSSNFTVEGLKLLPYPFQNVGIEFSQKMNASLNADQPGLGKTIQAIGAIRSKGSFPCVVLCPANIKIKWYREIEKWTDHTAFIVHGNPIRGFKGRSGQLTAEVVERINNGEFNFIIVNYEMIFRHENISFIRKFNPAAIILDEVHYLTNSKAKRTEAVQTLVSGREPKRDERGNVVKGAKGKTEYAQVHHGITVRYALTGTPILNRPVELIPVLQILGRFEELFPAQMYNGKWVSSWEYFVCRYCDAKKVQAGRKKVWDTSGHSNKEELRQILRSSCMIRRKKSEVLKELPPKQHNRIPVMLSNQSEYDKAVKDFFKWIREEYKLKESELAEIESLPVEEQEKAIYNLIEGKVKKADRAKTLTHMNALKQITARGKKDAAVEWINDFLVSGEKLVVFSIYRETQKMLMDEYKGMNVAHIFSSDDLATRDAQIQKFQTDPDCKLMFAALGTTAVSSPATQGIELHAASNVLFLEFGWNPALHEQAADRVHRIGQMAEAIFIWWMFAEESIDEFCLELIDSKQQVISAIIDGTESEDYDPSMVSGVISKMMTSSVA